MAESVKKTKPIAFKAETQQLLDILINSIYSDKDVLPESIFLTIS